MNQVVRFFSVPSLVLFLLLYRGAQAQSGLGYDLLPPSKQWTLVGSRWFACCLSLFGSTSIMYLILRKRQWYESGAFYHIMIGICVADFVCTITLILQGVLFPKETMLPIATGNIRTCEALGFFFVAPVASAVYICGLTLYFLLIVRYGWTENVAKKYFQPWIHLLAFLSSISFGVAGLATQSFNPNIVSVTCGFAPIPGDCLSDENVPCRRGEWAEILFLANYSALILLSLCSIVCLWLLYAFVRRQTRRNQRYDFSHGQGVGAASATAIQKSRQDQAVFVQACSYTVAAFSLLFVFIIVLIYRSVVINDKNFDLDRMYGSSHYFLFRLVIATLFPLQGFFNWAIFVRPALYQWKAAVPEKSFFWAYQQMLHGRLPPPRVADSHQRIQQVTYTGTSSLNQNIRRNDRGVVEVTEDTETSDCLPPDKSSSTLGDLSQAFTQPLEIAEIRRSQHIRASQMLRTSKMVECVQEFSGDEESIQSDGELLQIEDGSHGETTTTPMNLVCTRIRNETICLGSIGAGAAP